ncbi:MAG: tRNA pseudouridine(38-40) synthase TruA [Candidatus Babeliaceae bacterium]|jgi:tRNA pseudouridine38-40 synthase
MSYYKLIIAYSGTAYHGWQQQKDAVSVAGMLQARFKKTFGHDITLVGASRTDAGVHAMGQVAVFKTEITIEPTIMMRAWNGCLPPDILIRSLDFAPEIFHPQRNVLEKTYYYHIFTQRPLPWFAPYGLYYYRPLDNQKLHDALQVFAGTHDFRSFCTGDDMECTIRTVNSLTFSYMKRYSMYRIIVKGPGFLRYMIRRMVGAAINVASTDIPVEKVTEVLEQKHPLHTLPTAPAHGLMLRKIIYTMDTHE